MSFRPPHLFLIPTAFLAVSIGTGAAMPTQAQQQERNGPTLVQPADGTTVDRQFTVRVGFAGRGPADGTGITADNRPDSRPLGGRAAPPTNGPSDDTGLAPTGERRAR